MSATQVLPQDQTIGLLLERSQRPNSRVPLRETFVQKRTPSGSRKGGPLSTLVRDPRGLELLLLSHAVASAGDFSVTEWATTWARTIGLFDPTSGPTAVSRAWKRLEDGRLIRRDRGQGGKARIAVYSSTEREMANILDDAEEIAAWARLQTGDLPILWTEGGREYNPDFMAVEKDGVHWLVEVKMDKEMSSDTVKGKREAARRWANYVSADDLVDETWRYCLVSEADVKTAHGSWEAVKKLGV